MNSYIAYCRFYFHFDKIKRPISFLRTAKNKVDMKSKNVCIWFCEVVKIVLAFSVAEI